MTGGSNLRSYTFTSGRNQSRQPCCAQSPLGASLRGANAPEVAPRIHEHINEDGPGDFDMIYSPSSSARLRIPVDRHFDDNFFKAVAATYSTLAALSPRPAAEIAEANKVIFKTAADAEKAGFKLAKNCH